MDPLVKYRSFSPQMNEELKRVFEKYGLVNARVNARIGSAEVRVKIDVDWKRADGKTPEELRFEECAHSLGLDPEMLGKTFTWLADGKRYRVTGMLNRPRTDKIIQVVRVDNGKTYVMPPRAVSASFGLAGVTKAA